MSLTDNALKRLRAALHPRARNYVSKPLIQAPMAGVATPELATATMLAGGVGSLGVGGSTSAAIATLLERQVSLNAPGAHLNFFVHSRPEAARDCERRWLDHLSPMFDELGVAPPTELSAPYPTFDDNPELLELLLDYAVPLVSFHFGLPNEDALAALRKRGTTLLASATSVSEAKTLVAAGIDIVIAQGWEAGGHRGYFGPESDQQLSTMTLVTQLATAVSQPVIAAGGIALPASVQAALSLGAAGVQVGTAFVSSPESAASTSYRKALTAPQPQTQMTAGFSGRPARALVNRYAQAYTSVASNAPDYPITYAAHRALMAAIKRSELPIDKGEKEIEFAAMWAGQGVGQSPVLPAAELVGWLMD